jgi:hypothetical protein
MLLSALIIANPKFMNLIIYITHYEQKVPFHGDFSGIWLIFGGMKFSIILN